MCLPVTSQNANQVTWLPCLNPDAFRAPWRKAGSLLSEQSLPSIQPGCSGLWQDLRKPPRPSPAPSSRQPSAPAGRLPLPESSVATLPPNPQPLCSKTFSLPVIHATFSQYGIILCFLVCLFPPVKCDLLKLPALSSWSSTNRLQVTTP